MIVRSGAGTKTPLDTDELNYLKAGGLKPAYCLILAGPDWNTEESLYELTHHILFIRAYPCPSVSKSKSCNSRRGAVLLESQPITRPTGVLMVVAVPSPAWSSLQEEGLCVPNPPHWRLLHHFGSAERGIPRRDSKMQIKKVFFVMGGRSGSSKTWQNPPLRRMQSFPASPACYLSLYSR
jgi:hypothetical protein